MRYSIKQLWPFPMKAYPVSAANTQDALDIVGMMVERGAIEVEIIDANGLRYDLIDLERTFDEENGLGNRRLTRDRAADVSPSRRAMLSGKRSHTAQ